MVLKGKTPAADPILQRADRCKLGCAGRRRAAPAQTLPETAPPDGVLVGGLGCTANNARARRLAGARLPEAELLRLPYFALLRRPRARLAFDFLRRFHDGRHRAGRPGSRKRLRARYGTLRLPDCALLLLHGATKRFQTANRI